MRPVLKGLVAERKLVEARILGSVNHGESPAYLDPCDVLVLFSVHEQWGLVANEAMNSGKATIVSNQLGCAAFLVRYMGNIYAFREDSVEDLKGAVAAVTAGGRAVGQTDRKSLGIICGWDFEADAAAMKSGLRAARVS